MNRTRYLPPGSMRRQLRRGRIEGSIGTLLLVCAIGFALVAATPAEMYRPAPATHHPTPAGEAAPAVGIQIPPCTGAGKDCSEPDAITLLPRTGPTLRPLPHHANTVPEPGTLALIGAGLAGLIWRARS
jgi:hypothetical protein